MPKYKSGLYKVVKDNIVIAERALIQTKKSMNQLIREGYLLEEVN